MKKIIVFCGLGLLLLFPFVGLMILSSFEQNQYKPNDSLEIQQVAYGPVYTVVREDLKEYITVDGKGVSSKTVFQELNQYKEPYRIRFIIDLGDYVENGETIGYYYSQPVLATTSGIVASINLGEDSYIRYDSTEQTQLLVQVTSNKVIDLLNQENVTLTDDVGNAYTVVKRIKANDSDSKQYLLQANNQQAIEFGKEYEQLQLYTGKVYNQALVVNKDCVYSYPEDKKRYYVREVDEANILKGEVEVQIGFECGDYISISGIDEGAILDGGYKQLISSEDQ